MDKANAAFTARTETWNPTMSDVLRLEPRPARLPGEAGAMLGIWTEARDLAQHKLQGENRPQRPLHLHMIIQV